MSQTTTKKTQIQIQTQLFTTGKRVFVSLPKSSHTGLQKFENHAFLKVVLRRQQNDKKESISFAAKIVRTKLRGSNIMYVEIPLSCRSRVCNSMFVKGSIIVTISQI
jgi:small nuclear ribonucleoprotein (snRNP)-like protein